MYRVIYIVFLLVLLGGCGKDTPEPIGRFNPTGTSGLYNEEAERAFAKAHVLWKYEKCLHPDRAIQLLTTAIKLEPGYGQAWLRRGLAYSDKHWYELALKDMDQAVRLGSTSEAYAYRGLVEMRMGNYAGALVDLQRAISLDADNHRAWNFRAAVYYLQNNVDAACENWQEGCENGDCTGFDNAQEEGICE